MPALAASNNLSYSPQRHLFLVCFCLCPSLRLAVWFQVVLQLLDLEEATSEHEYEGEFYLCNLNSSQILLENVCVMKAPSAFNQVPDDELFPRTSMRF